ncbi:MAG: hypothetical protein RR543_04585 [Erysipelotrichales bacterium]
MNYKIFNLAFGKRMLILLFGFFLIALGIVIALKGKVGVNPWDVLHQGVALHTGLPIGLVNIIVGMVVLLLGVFIKVYPGFGTILNIAVIGSIIDVLMKIIPEANGFVEGIAFNIVGSIIMALGVSLYLFTKTGAGPRDSFMLGIMQRYRIDTKYVKPAIEGVVLIIGIILGGNFGIGTFISLLVTGYMVDVFFKLLNFDPKVEKQLNMIEQIKTLRQVECSCK